MGGCYSSRVGDHKKQKASVSPCRASKGRVMSNTQKIGIVNTSENGSLKEDRPKGADSNHTHLEESTITRVTEVANGSKEEAWYSSEASFATDSEDEYASVLGDFVASTGNTPFISRSVSSSPKHTYVFTKPESLVGPLQLSKSSVSVDFQRHQNEKSELLRTESIMFSFETGSETQRHREVSIPSEDEVTSLKQNIPGMTTYKHTAMSVTPDYGDSIEDRKHQDHFEKSLSNASCMPCLMNGMIFCDKKKCPSSPSHSQKKKASQLFPVKEQTFLHSGMELFKEVLKMPPAGVQVPYSADSAKDGCWSTLSPSSFKLRASSYLKDKRKQPAPPNAIYEAFAVDVFLSDRKINNIAKFVELPLQYLPTDDEIPNVFIFNIQIPLYPASIFLGDSDGKGLSVILYFKISESFKNEAPVYVKEMLKKLINNDMEKVKGLFGDLIMPFRERLKIIARVCNPEEINLSATERKLMLSYNEKPILSRPQHLFYKGTNYFEVDLDVHQFNFIARKAVESFRERLKLCILDIGLTIQGNNPEELPEQMLCCVRLNKLDLTNFHYLNTEVGSTESALDVLKGPPAQ